MAPYKEWPAQMKRLAIILYYQVYGHTLFGYLGFLDNHCVELFLDCPSYHALFTFSKT